MANMTIEIDLPFSEVELGEAVLAAENGNKEPLRALCRKEVDRFEAYLRDFGSRADNHLDRDWVHGLARFERMVVEGYIYQKVRGHIDATTNQDHAGGRREDGAQTSP
jgi:hypothetical protein